MIKRGDVFFMKLSEDGCRCIQRGIRPYVIIQNDIGNQFSPTTIVAPLTSHLKKLNQPTHVIVSTDKISPSVVLLEQIRTIDVDVENWRLFDHLPPDLMYKIDKAIRISLGV